MAGRLTRLMMIASGIGVILAETPDEFCKRKVGTASYCRWDNGTCQGTDRLGRTVMCFAKAPSEPFAEEPRRHHARHEESRHVDSDEEVSKSAGAPHGVRYDPEGFFLWAEWPEQVADEPHMWEDYYNQMISFIMGNRAGIRVNRLILRVMRPNVKVGHSKLWQVDPEGAFFKFLLARLPAGIEVRIYPYLDDRYTALWKEDMRTSTATEGVFKYVKQLNALLAAEGVNARVSGVVTDYEEHTHHKGEHVGDLIPVFKRAYSAGAPGGMLTFGTSVGYDMHTSVFENPDLDNVDEFYMQMYDWYVPHPPGTPKGVPARRIDGGDPEYVNDPVELFSALMRRGNFKPEMYASPKFQFMWSVQAAKASNCRYPLLASEHWPFTQCGNSNQFGTWRPDKFHAFLNLVKGASAELGDDRSHGIYEFNFMPKSWF